MCHGGDMDDGKTGWAPPHCPNRNCKYFKPPGGAWRYKRKGFYTRQLRPRRIQRYTCLTCGCHFSTQSFSTTYWQKRPELMAAIFWMVVGCMANRQIARALGCSPSTVAHQIARLGRHCLLFHAGELSQIGALHTIAIDGFESFEWSQYFPFHHNVAVCVDTGYFLFHTDSPLRRKGRMTPTQKVRRERLEASLGRADPRAVETAMRELLEALAQNRPLATIRSDDHRAYPRAMRALPRDVTHEITSAKARRDARNPLWEVNVLDLMIRHSTAAHKRETIAWAKRRQASVEKLAIFQVWRNAIKKRWENGSVVTSAMLCGVRDRPLRVGDVFRKRLFYGHLALPKRWRDYYRRRILTAALRVNRTHELTYAF